MDEKAGTEAGCASAESRTIKTESFTGLSKLIVQVSRGLLTPETFLQEVYVSFKEIGKQLREVRERLAGLKAEGEGRKYLQRLSDDVECCDYIFRLALMQFEAFVNREEPSGLRVGAQLIEKARSTFEDIVKSAQARAGGGRLSERRDAIGAIAAEASANSFSDEAYRQALEQLQAVYEPLEDKGRRLQENVIKGAKELVDFENDSAELRRRGAELLPKISELADAYGLMILSVYAPDYTRRSISNLLLSEEVKDSDRL